MIVGLTGGIGSGKSTVAHFFRNLGVPVYDSDNEAKALMVSSKTLRKGIIELFGEEAYLGERLNRIFISEQVFKSAELLQSLNAIVHPAVKKDFLQWVEKQKAPYVIQESALIFENASQGNYDKVIVVSAPQEVRLQRVMKRDNVNEVKILERIAHQLPDKQKKDLADFVIENDDLPDTSERVSEIHDQLMRYVKSC